MISLIIAGSRDFNDYELLVKEVDKYLLNIVCSLEVDLTEKIIPIEVVCGGARGADKLGERYAKERNLIIKYFIPDWKKGKGAGYIRNEEMAKYGTHCICFWDEISRGTKHMINIANKYKLDVKVVKLLIPTLIV